MNNLVNINEFHIFDLQVFLSNQKKTKDNLEQVQECPN